MRTLNMQITTEAFAAVEVKSCAVKGHARFDEPHVTLAVSEDTRWSAESLRELASALGAVAEMMESSTSEK